ncbi:ATP-dependent zinc metalloprotease FtsH [Candidatus Berkiella cookevillensis]|uniref:ATP-dependent zinc metalloprotease FtsH n=2 Tax=Candidatus Berkiella cookevillensis TaxID=437022 RepID=A0A0Q9YDI9_9GAMM|nr:ATP-dependent zinc metalloprotease FtsH [Candidatus Berkiella cookevillensis]MCS5707830.1 ATP-dependent zinc metalloprotease FtsH [Candidatus Berkiella cookevillensis]
MVKNLVLWLIIAVILISVFSNFGPRHAHVEKIPYSTFVEQVEHGNVKSVTIDERSRIIRGMTRNEEGFSTNMIADEFLMGELLNKKVEVNIKAPEQQSLLMSIFISWFPIILFIGVWLYFMRQMQGGGGRGAMTFGKSRARLLGEDQVKVTFADVAGVDEAKEEVQELVEFLKDPDKFQRLGGRIPRGVLMVGQPGTGKTLLAKAIAGEAKAPFFTISGSDFVEMFVGVGASRVRDMFEQAKKHAPCIIFIDEIDAVGRHRGAGLGGGHDEREQTLNQLLVEMDGFEGNEGVIVIAATNRPDVLDKALLRPGRFDRQVVVGLPDIRGREQILKVHMRKIPLADNVEPKIIARGTPGFSGADLANLVNEAALFAARHNKRLVDMAEFDAAKDKIMMGVERRSLVMTLQERTITAYHEAGHAIVGLTVPEHDPVYKVTIIPRAQALGLTMFLPEQDRYGYSKLRLESKIASCFGGRIAEELIFGFENVTTGASSDIQHATEIARNMVTKWGLSERLGPLMYSDDEGEVFLGHSVTTRKEISGKTAQIIDEEVKSIIDKTYKTAKDILTEKIDILHKMAEALLKYETIDSSQLEDLMSGKIPREPKDWSSISKDDASGGLSSASRSADKKQDEEKRDIQDGDTLQTH